jgi:hypothetical protein
MTFFADRVKDTTTTTGTGSVTLAGAAPTGYQTFATALGSESRAVFYVIELNGEWEVGKGTFNGTTTLARDAVVYFSSNSNALVNFSAGTKNVFLTFPSVFAFSRGMAQAMSMDAYSI